MIWSEKACETYFHHIIVKGNKRQVNDYLVGRHFPLVCEQ